MAGVVSDYTGGRATTCWVMLMIAAPMVSVTSLNCYQRFLMQQLY